ncbi:MAG TPA: aldehyde dehydrogenase family protein, partial [Stellaceae bacterium]|nr:aldehyde dehydrogenase family protein [Stellaceae bacterium]
EVKRELVAYAATVKLGDGSHQGTDLGPIQNRMQYEKLKDLLADTKRIGATMALGGEVPDGPGYFVPVTIVDNPPDDSRVVTEEAFGPVLPLLKFRDADEVVARANATHYGLAGSVWSRDVAAARAIAERLECGTVWINEVHVFGPHIAFGGHKQSGMGVENARDGLAEYTNPQTIMSRDLAP